MTDVSPSVAACMSDMASEILSLRARLAEVLAVFGDRDCPNGYEVNEPGCDCYVCKVRAAARGEDDQ